MIISQMLKEIRENAGLSQEQFAEKLAISRQAVSKWERGVAMPDIENLMYISNIFNVSLDTIIKGDKKMENKIISDNKNAKFISRLFLAGFFCSNNGYFYNK
jgi:transcriptional regulator with XRE-family HTH domain